MKKIRALDLFCGAGGSSWGAREAGVKIVAAFDLWPLAGKAHDDNFPEAEFIQGRLEEHDVAALAKRFGKIDLILASPECTNHSPAKGNKPRCEVSKDTAFQVVRFAKAFSPRWVVTENVVNMKKWTRYAEFKSALEALGYRHSQLEHFTSIQSWLSVCLVGVDVFSKVQRSDLMSRIRGAGNKGTELRLIQVFRNAGIKSWRRGSKLPGKPDFVFSKLKTAVFVDGCFWHGCPMHATWPKNRAAFWLAKLTGNKARDRRVNRELRKLGWKVVRIWEHELRRKNEVRLLRKLRTHLVTRPT